MRLPVECITAPASSLRRAVLSLLPGALSRLALSEAEGSKRAWPGVRYGGDGSGGEGLFGDFDGGRERMGREVGLHVLQRSLESLKQVLIRSLEAVERLQRAGGAAAHGAIRVCLTAQAAVEADHHQREGQRLGVIGGQRRHPVDEGTPDLPASARQMRNEV